MVTKLKSSYMPKRSLKHDRVSNSQPAQAFGEQRRADTLRANIKNDIEAEET